MGKTECFLYAYWLLKFVSYIWILVREELLKGLCWKNDLLLFYFVIICHPLLCRVNTNFAFQIKDCIMPSISNKTYCTFFLFDTIGIYRIYFIKMKKQTSLNY